MQLVQCLAFVSTAAALAPVRQLAKPLLQAAAPVAAFAAAPAFAEGLETTLQVANNLADTDVSHSETAQRAKSLGSRAASQSPEEWHLRR
mmetsp:Transcript_33130/g.113968  ORF Transcript_33130/g.113968 Transcript_33130/m.113968 type:complete len:90 (+) Transcript_33130:47-316(+)